MFSWVSLCSVFLCIIMCCTMGQAAWNKLDDDGDDDDDVGRERWEVRPERDVGQMTTTASRRLSHRLIEHTSPPSHRDVIVTWPETARQRPLVAGSCWLLQTTRHPHTTSITALGVGQATAGQNGVSS